MIKYVVIANASTMSDTDYYFSGFSKDGSIVHLSRYFEEAKISDLSSAQHNIAECRKRFGYCDNVEFRIEEVAL